MQEALPKKNLPILFIHNTYLQKGGEDSVVKNEISTLRQYGYPIMYQEFSNRSFQGSTPAKLLLILRIFFNMGSFFKIYFQIKKNGIKIVHVHNFFYSASPSVFWAAKAAGAKTLFTMHNYRLFCLNGIFFREGKVCFACHTNGNFKMGIKEACFKSSRFSSRILSLSTLLHRRLGTWRSRVDRFVVINPFMKELLIHQGIGPDKIIVKHNVLTDYDHKAIKDYKDRNDFYLFVGRLSTEKGVHHLLEAFKRSGKKLVIAGDGDLADYVKENKTANIEYLGALPKAEIFQLYETCTALVFSSLWIEGMPMTIIEAQSSGAICIVAESINTKGMIDHNHTGFLYEAGNIDNLNRVINIFESKDPEERNQLSQNIYRQFLAIYSEEQYVKSAEQLYQL